MLKTADFKTCAQIQPKRGWCFVRKLFLCIFFFLFPIFSFATALPSGYTQLEYIQSDGTQFIDTGIVPADNFDVTVTVSFDDLLGIVLDSRTTTRTSDRLIILGHTDSGLGYDYGELDQSITRPAYDDLEINTKYKIQLSGTLNHVDYYVNNQLTASQNTNRQSSTYNLWLFNANTGSTATIYGLKGKMYSCKIINNGETVRNFVPARRNSDNTVGMYDTVTNTFFGVSHTGYYVLDYIEGTGTQYIDTGIKPNSNTEIEAKFSLNSVDNYQCLVGARIRNEAQNQNKDSFTIWANTVGNQIRFDYDERVTNSNINVSVNTPYVVTKIKERNYVNGIETDSNTVSTFTCDYNLFLFGVNTFGDSPKPYYMDGKIYYVKIWDNGTLVRDFIPVQRISDGVIGMLDKISDQFFTNAGTGTFTTGTNVGTYTPNFIAGPVVLPSEYTELNHITTNHDAYILTNLTVNDFDRVTARIKLYDYESESPNEYNYYYPHLFGSTASQSVGALYAKYFRIYDPVAGGIQGVYNNIGSQNWNKSVSNTNIPLDVFTDLDIKLADGEQYIKINGATVASNTRQDGILDNTILITLFAHNYAGTIKNISHLDCEYMTFYKGNNIVANFIPAKRNADDAIGMYDTVTNTFFENAGTGTFVAGPAVDDPGVSEPSCEYTRLEYLKSSDAQYIQDNSFQPISTGAIEIKTKDLRTYTRFAGWDGLVALATPNSVTNYFPFLYGSWDDYNPNPVSIVAENALRYEFEPGLQKLYVNGMLNRQAQKNTSIYSAPFRMFIVSTGGGYNHGSTIYYCRVYDGNNVLLRNYIPVKRNSDNVLGMYDTVTKTFFTNAGTGTFIAGPELAWGNNCSVTISITWGGLTEPDASGMCTYGETFTAPSTAPTAPSGLKFLGWIPR